MSGEVEWRPILHVRPKFDVFTLPASSGLIDKRQIQDSQYKILPL